MTNLISKFFFIAAALFVVGCDGDDALSHTKVSAVEALYFPEDNRFYNLEGQSSVVFEWQAARAEDNGVVLYEVAFDREGEDFSNPVYVIPSGGKGLQRTLELSFTQLNQIAGMAGIEPESTGKLQWTVHSSKGINSMESNLFRTIEVKRPGGYPTPDGLFITGSATEAGDNLADAIPMKKIGSTIFEVYTSLSEGEYQFVTRNSGMPEKYYIDNGKLKLDGKTSYTGEEKIYNIQIDFSDGSVELTEILKVELFFAPTGQFLFELPYNGNGTWLAESKTIEFKQESWGRDERYKFLFTVVKNDEPQGISFGSTKADNQRPDASTSPSYWYVVPVPTDRWNNSFKFASEVDMNTVDIEVIFNTEVPEYTHKVTIVE